MSVSRADVRTPSVLIPTVLFLLGLMAVQVTWAVVTPPFDGIDEIDHAFRASSVSLGHLRPDPEAVPNDRGRGDYIPVRADIARAGGQVCRTFRYSLPDNCNPHQRLADGTVLIGSSAARYDPAFYVITGWASRPFHGTQALYAMRGAAILLSVALAGGIAALALRTGRTRWPLALVMAALTPQVSYSASVATPNGLNIVAGLGVWVALTHLFVTDQPRAGADRGLALSVGAVSASVLLSTHSLGGLWLALCALTTVAVAGPRRVGLRVREARRTFAMATAVVVLVAVGASGWMLAAHTNDPNAEPLSHPRGPFPGVLYALVQWPLQAVAAFPSREQVARPAVYVAWLLIAVVVFSLAVRAARPRVRIGLLLVVAISFAVPVVLTMVTFRHLGLAWQGRYGLPYSVGAFVLAGSALDRRPPGRLATPVAGALMALVAIGTFESWLSTIDNVMVKPFWRHSASWHPPATVWLGLTSAAVALLWAAALVVHQRPAHAD